MNPTMNMFGIKHLREQDGKEYFHNVFPHLQSTLMCVSLKEKISQIRVREALPEEETPYYAWKHPDSHITMIYPSKVQVEMCFPYGSEIATKKGRGKMIKVVITETLDEINFCDEFSPEDMSKTLELFSEMELRGLTVQSLMDSFRNSLGEYPKIGAHITIDSHEIVIMQKNEKGNLHYITIDDEIEFYYIGFEGRQWFFKEYKTYKYIKLIIYGKDDEVIPQ